MLKCETIIHDSIPLLIARSHDDIAKLMRIPAMPFDVMYPEKAKEIKRMVNEYVKVLRRDHFINIQDPNNGVQKPTITIDETGYPVAPRPQSWTKVTKADLEPLYRFYITQHYRTSPYFSPVTWMWKCDLIRACMRRHGEAGSFRKNCSQDIRFYRRRLYADRRTDKGSPDDETRFTY